MTKPVQVAYRASDTPYTSPAKLICVEDTNYMTSGGAVRTQPELRHSLSKTRPGNSLGAVFRDGGTDPGPLSSYFGEAVMSKCCHERR